MGDNPGENGGSHTDASQDAMNEESVETESFWITDDKSNNKDKADNGWE